MSALFTEAEYQRMVRELLEGQPWLSEDDVVKAVQQMERDAVTAVMDRMWRDGDLQVGWNSDTEELTLRTAGGVR